jgi:16S rRNA (cytidine1402-2'-O)-methyltransferase
MPSNESCEQILYILPNLIGEHEAFIEMIAIEHPEITKLNHFFVEKEKPARALVKRLHLETPQNDLLLTPIGKHQSSTTYLNVLKKVKYDIGLISDAGVPGVADPGSTVVLEAHKLGFQVVPLAGPSSIINALSASGLNGQQFTFHGYLPVRTEDLKAKLTDIIRDSVRTAFTHIFIETPYRNMKLLETLQQVAPENTLFCIAAGIQTSNEFIRTRRIAEWKNSGFPNIHKVPAVFLIGHNI